MATLHGQALEKIARDREIEKNDFQIGKHNNLLSIFFLGAACALLCYYKATQEKKSW